VPITGRGTLRPTRRATRPGSAALARAMTVTDVAGTAGHAAGEGLSASTAAASAAADVVLLVDRLERLVPGLATDQRARAIAFRSVIAGLGLLTLGVAAALGYLTPVHGALLQEANDVAVILYCFGPSAEPGQGRAPAEPPARRMGSAVRMTQINARPRAACEEWAGRRGRAMTRIGRSGHGLAAWVRGGALYFAAVFALGFAFALVRDGVLQLGAAEATRLQAALVEIPLLLVAAWAACRIIVRRLGVPPTNAARVLMGVTAFALIILAEAATGVLLLGRALEAHLATYLIPSHAAGLAGQMVFAAFPWMQGVRSGRTPQAGKVTDRGPDGAHLLPRMAVQDRRGGTR
jgi:hypothetical protein